MPLRHFSSHFRCLLIGVGGRKLWMNKTERDPHLLLSPTKTFLFLPLPPLKPDKKYEKGCECSYALSLLLTPPSSCVIKFFMIFLRFSFLLSLGMSTGSTENANTGGGEPVTLLSVEFFTSLISTL